MSFAPSAWTLTIFFFLISLITFFLSYKTVKTRKRFIDTKEVLFIVALAYLLLAHFAMFVSIGESLDDSISAPCENVLNSTSIYFVYGDNYTGYHWDYETAPPVCNNPTATECINLFHTEESYTYVDSCADRTITASSSALVVVFTWLLFAIFFSIMFMVIAYLTRFARDMF